MASILSAFEAAFPELYAPPVNANGEETEQPAVADAGEAPQAAATEDAVAQAEQEDPYGYRMKIQEITQQVRDRALHHMAVRETGDMPHAGRHAAGCEQVASRRKSAVRSIII